MAAITAIICTYNRYDLLGKAIESLRQQELDKSEYRILVVDNSPDQEAVAKHAKAYSRVKNLRYIVEKTPGLSNARNVGARQVDTPFVAFMDDDAIARPGWLAEIIRAFNEFGDDTAVVGGQVVPMWEEPRPPWLSPKIEGHVSVVNWGGKLREASESEWFAGTNISFRVSDLLATGGFSTSLGRKGSGATLLSNEEVEVVAAIRAAGKHLVYAPEAVVDHLVESARLRRTWFRKRFSWQATSDFIMDPAGTVAQAHQHWENVLNYVAALPPRERSMRALMYDTDDSELFVWQLGALYALTVLLLAGFDGVEL